MSNYIKLDEAITGIFIGVTVSVIFGFSTYLVDAKRSSERFERLEEEFDHRVRIATEKLQKDGAAAATDALDGRADNSLFAEFANARLRHLISELTEDDAGRINKEAIDLSRRTGRSTDETSRLLELLSVSQTQERKRMNAFIQIVWALVICRLGWGLIAVLRTYVERRYPASPDNGMSIVGLYGKTDVPPTSANGIERSDAAPLPNVQSGE